MAALLVLLHISIAMVAETVGATTFTVKNNCPQTIWPATLSGATSPSLSSTGFVLSSGSTFTLDAPLHWSGRIWARTSCSKDSSGNFKCLTGDCASNQLTCNGAGGIPPVSLVEFTLNGNNGMDFYDVSLVDGFNVPVSVIPSISKCTSVKCSKDVNQVCPPELQVKARSTKVVISCKSACLAFGSPKYCCTGEYGSPQTCKPTKYSTVFKSSCPQAYSYPYDDASSTFTCSGANYQIVFCP